MNFLEARKILAEFAGGPELHLLLGMSGTGEPLDIYVKAAAARRGLKADVRFLPFNTLQQALLVPTTETEREVFLLLPWDLVPELDWRSGLPNTRVNIADALAAADEVLSRITSRPAARLAYLPASLPPAFVDRADQDELSALLIARAVRAGARLLSSEDFSLASYFASGLPVAARSIGSVANVVVELAVVDRSPAPAKVLVTDL